MDSQSKANFVDFQTTTKYFFDIAQQCFDHCVKDFSNKDLTTAEKDRTQACFAK